MNNLQNLETAYQNLSVEQLEKYCKELQTLAESFEWNKPLSDSTYNHLNTTFNEIHNWISYTPPDIANQLLADPRISTHLEPIHRLRAMWEFEYEKRTALQIISSPSPSLEVEKLLTANLATTTLHQDWFLQRAKNDWKNCLVIGSGPLPTTVMLLHQLTDLSITCIDRDAESCHIAAELNTAIEAPATEYLVADAMDFEEIEQYDVILTTVLTGVSWKQIESNERSKLLQRLLKVVDNKTSLLIRSAYGLGGLVYPMMPPSSLSGKNIKHFEPPVLGRSSLYLVESDHC